MRNLWLFISKYNAFFLFSIFFVVSLVILVNNNPYQRASMLNSSNQLTGGAYERINQFTSYLNLGITNEKLAAENARLKSRLKLSQFNDSVLQKTVNDTVNKQQYTYIVAKVVNNSVHQKNNYLTINRGSRHGIKKGMGVIGPTGIVGIVYNVSDHYATVQSVLHADSRISASVLPGSAFGSLVWGENNYNPRVAYLEDIPNHLSLKKGQSVVTSGFSLFPAGIAVGRIISSGQSGGNSFLNIKVALSTDFTTLAYVYVVNNMLSAEQKNLEEQNKTE